MGDKVVIQSIQKNDDGYEYYGSQTVLVKDTETGEERVGVGYYTPNNTPADAQAVAIQDALSKF